MVIFIFVINAYISMSMYVFKKIILKKQKNI